MAALPKEGDDAAAGTEDAEQVLHDGRPDIGIDLGARKDPGVYVFVGGAPSQVAGSVGFLGGSGGLSPKP